MAAEKDIEKNKKKASKSVDGKKVIQEKKKEKKIREKQIKANKEKNELANKSKPEIQRKKQHKQTEEKIKNKQTDFPKKAIKPHKKLEPSSGINKGINQKNKRNYGANNKAITSSSQTNVWDTLGLPNIKEAVKKTTDTEEFRWAVFLASALGLVIILIFLYIGGNVFLKHYKVETVFVEGSTHYTNKEIQDMVMEGPLGDNSIYLGFKYKDKAIENVPFVQRMDVEVIDAKSIRIRVYEKAVAGYFEHLGRYVYFDKDGIVIETSEKETSGIPLVTGLKFNYVVMYEPLPVEKKEIFEDILDITQLLKKYEISADRIYFDKDNKKTLYFGKARVSLGTNDNIDEKILKLKYILPKLEGLSGVLRMDNYAEGVTNITFEEDKK